MDFRTMKKLLLAFALFLFPSIAMAQCNGVFAANTVCGNATGSATTPRQVSPSLFQGSARGTNGQIQYNNSGTLGGFTASGDCTINTTTGAVSCPFTGDLSGSPAAATVAKVRGLSYKSGATYTNGQYPAWVAVNNDFEPATPAPIVPSVPFVNTNAVGLYDGLQVLKLGNAVIATNPGTFADSTGANIYATTQVLSADLSTGTINTGTSPFTGGMLSPGGLSITGTTTDGVDVQLYMVKRNSDGGLALVGDNANVYSGSTNSVITNSSNSWSTGGPPTGFWNGTLVRLTCTSYPTGFSAGTNYWAVNETNGQLSTTFGLASSYNGTAITAGSASTGCSVGYGVQNHLDALFGSNVWTVLRGLHFAFRWKWQWGPGVGGIPDFTMDPRGDHVYLTDPGAATFTILTAGTATSPTLVDVSGVLSNLNRIVFIRALCTSSGTAGTASVNAPGTADFIPVCEGPTSGMTTAYNNGVTLQTDSQGHVQYEVSGGAKLTLAITGWMFVDPR